MKDWARAGNWSLQNYTYLNQIWKTQNSHTAKETNITPFGMVKTISNIFSHKRCYNIFNVLLKYVKSELNFTEETFNKDFISLDILHKGSKNLKVVSCYIFAILFFTSKRQHL